MFVTFLSLKLCEMNMNSLTRIRSLEDFLLNCLFVPNALYVQNSNDEKILFLYLTDSVTVLGAKGNLVVPSKRL